MKKSKTTTILHGASWPYGSEKTCEKCDKTFRAFEEGAPVASVHSVLALAPDRMIEGALDDVQERQASRSPESRVRALHVRIQGNRISELISEP